jgi:hypothetical protein
MKKQLIVCWLAIALSSNVFSQTTVFFDDFESGAAQWELTGTWGLEESFPYSGSWSLSDSPGGDYQGNTITYASLAEGLDLTAYLFAQLSFWTLYDLETEFDYVYIEASADDFNTFSVLGSISGENALDTTSPWQEMTYSLGAYLGQPNVKVRFKFVSDPYYNTDGFYADDVAILGSNTDMQPPAWSHDPPDFYKGSTGPMAIQAELYDISGISETWLNFKVDGVLQNIQIAGYVVDNNIYQYVIPSQLSGANVDYWLTAVDSSPLSNIVVTDTFHYISGNYLVYDDGAFEYYISAGPNANNPDITGFAVRFTVPDSTPNLVTALIRNYTDPNNPNSPMLFHVWSTDAGGGIGYDLITPFLVIPEATLWDWGAFTRIDLRPYSDQLSNIQGDVFAGFTVPSGRVNILISSPSSTSRSFYLEGNSWITASSDYFFRAITGTYHKDVGVTALITPASGNGLGQNQGVTVNIKNFGTESQSDIPISYSLDGILQVVDTISDTVAPGGNLNYTFSVTADLSVCTTYIFDINTYLPGDQNNGNDHLSDTITNNPVEYCNNLHYDGANYTGIGLVNGGTFEVAVRYPASLTFPLTGGYLKEVSIYLKNYPSSVILKVWGQGSPQSPGTEIYLQDITDLISAGWNTIPLDTLLIADGTDLWVGYEVTHYAGQHPAGIDAGPPNPDAYWIHLGTGSWTSTIGNWNIRTLFCRQADSVDVAVTGIVSPVASTNLGQHEPVTVRVKNLGIIPVASIPVVLSVNGSTIDTDTITETIEPGMEYDYTFSHTADMHDTGEYGMLVSASLSGDQNAFNDNYYTTIIHISFTECDTLHFDVSHQSNMGLTNGGTLTVAARFPEYMTVPVVSGVLEKVVLYIGDMPTSCVLKIWESGNSSGPGNIICSKDISSQLSANSWNEILLDTSIVVESQGFWAGFQVSHTPGAKPIGCDGSSANVNGSWWSPSPGVWSHPPGYAAFGNWNIRAKICPSEEPGPSLEGDIVYANANQTGVGNATVFLKSGDSVISQVQADSAGHYLFTEVAPGEYVVTAATVHDWGGANAVDALQVLRHFVEVSPLTGIYLIAADVNADGNINALDGLTIVRRFVGMTSSFDLGDWIFEGIPVTIGVTGTVYQSVVGICTGDVDGSFIP